MVDVIEVSKSIVSKYNKKNIHISMLKLQKLLYFCQGYYMALHDGEPMFLDEFQAWKYGPVIYDVYNTYTDFYLSDYKGPADEERFSDIINKVITEKSSLTAWELVSETHVQDGPWEKIYSKYKWNEYEYCDEIIPKNLIYKYFKGKLENE